ncbi:MAG: sulfide/dihydroorotate dehydrogenase-like FAD/NAD-binding protein [Candidatus Ranarchaeia archaeon]
MYKIIDKVILANEVIRLDVYAPLIAKKWRPGQFVILRICGQGERIPLTIHDVNKGQGTVAIIFKIFGKTTKQLSELGIGDSILDFVGPLGKPSKKGIYGTCVCVGGGTGLAVMYPRAKQLKQLGNKVVSIIGARTEKDLILENEFRLISDTVHVATDDGSKGFHGFVTQILAKLIEDGQHIDFVYASGPVLMMAAVVEITKKHQIPTEVSLNPIMVDGTGLCGGCRVTVHGEVKFACVDGPEFDGLGVDFQELNRRNKAYLSQEQLTLHNYLKQHLTKG